MTVLLTNNAKTVLAGVLSPADTIIPLRAGTGHMFPQPVEPDDWFPLALTDVDGNVEYLRATSRMGDAIRVLRGQEGTQPRAYNPGDIVDLRLTVAALAEFRNGGTPEPALPTLSVSDVTVIANTPEH